MLPAKILAPLLRFFYRLLYYEFAWSYDFVAWFVSAGQWRHWVQSLLPYLKGETLLELGHGPGHLQIALAAQGRQIYGLDLSPFMNRQARRRLKRAQLTPRLVNGYAQSLPFSANSFEQIFATFPSEFILHPATLAETLRTLRPGGEFLILPSAKLIGDSLPARISNLLFYLTGQAHPSPTDFHQPAVTLLQGAGFAQVEIKTIQHSQFEALLIIARKPADLPNNLSAPSAV